MGVLQLLTSVLASLAPLDQDTTNGSSELGTLKAPLLSKFLSNNPLPLGFPWGKDTVTNTNPYTDAPDTGVVRSYNFTISRGVLAPDGYERSMILVNGQFPGPTIEANWGDTIQVNVQNNITDDPEGTSIHWHGFLLHNMPWMDGTSGITQCPIAPGKSFTYRFRAELFGTTWYHAHYSAQYTDGVVGPIVVHRPPQEDYDIDVGPILLSDWYHTGYRTLVENLIAPRPNQPPPRPSSNNNLINGKMNLNCSTASDITAKCSNNPALAQFVFQSGKRHRLRLINSGADATQQFSIDGHTMTVIANDFVPVQPYNTNVVTLGVGQRTDVIVQAIGNPNSSYWVRSIATCANAHQPQARAVVFYENADRASSPDSSPQTYTNDGCDNDPLEKTIPMYPIELGPPARTMTLSMTVGRNATGTWLWYMNNSSFRTDYDEPVLLLTKDGNSTQWRDSLRENVIDTGSAASIRIILNNHTPTAHLMHLHGHNMYIVSVGHGRWDGHTVVRRANPQRRDVQNVPAGGHLVWQFDADNPGAWAFHCHVAWHAAAGMGVVFVEHAAQIRGMDIPPPASRQVCEDWRAFAASAQVAQLNSGL